jgi:signal transduction histidine kinase/CheY-like chemotaxis protein
VVGVSPDDETSVQTQRARGEKTLMDPTATPTGGGRRDSSARRVELAAPTLPAATSQAVTMPPQLPYDMESRTWHIEGLDVNDSLKRALDVCEAAFDSIVDKSADGVIVVDDKGTICFTNAAAESMLGRATGELLGQRFAIPVVPGKSAEIDIFKRGAPQRIAEMRVVTTWWQGNPAFLATLRDITERKQAEYKAREGVRRRDEFLAILSHELRNPLAAISNAVSVLGSGKLDGRTFDKARGVIERQCGQISRLLEDLLDVSRVTRRKIELRMECLDLCSVIADAVDVVRPQVDAARQSLLVKTAATPIAVDGDPVRLQQILVNLLANASKYSQADDSIELFADIDRTEAVIRVRDHGIGLSAEMLDAVFEPFVQLQSSLDRAEGGLGLGLAIVDGLVRLHGGSVRAASAGKGKGSEFAVRLPLSKSRPKNRQMGTVARADGPLSILIIEDNADVRSMLKTLLEFAGHRVEIAGDGLLGVEMIEVQHPNVALVDIGLPGLNGYELARKIRADKDCQDVFLVALTGYSQPSDRQRALSSGFDAHLAKPVDLEQLRQILALVRNSNRASDRG